jgi:glutaredoxin
MSVVTLYGRPGCHLCDEARAGLEEMLAGGSRFELAEVNIEDDERLHRELLERIPVVEVDGERACELFLEPRAVLALIGTLSP